MTDSLKTAAKAGNTKALEAMMNQSFGSQGITVRVTNTGSLLNILLRGAEPPDPTLATSIKKGLKSIQPNGFKKVAVKAEVLRLGAVWNAKWNLPDLDNEEAIVVINNNFYKPKKDPKEGKELNAQESSIPKTSANKGEVEIGKEIQNAFEGNYDDYRQDPEISKIIQKATEQLDNDEVAEELVLFFVFSTMRFFGKDKHKLCGVSFATNKRVMEFSLDPISGFELESLPYPKISSIEFKEGNFTDEIELFTSGNSLKISKIIKGNTKSFVDFIHRKINEGSGESQPKSSANDIDIFLKLEKLAELRDKGILTPEEFESKKQEWLREL